MVLRFSHLVTAVVLAVLAIVPATKCIGAPEGDILLSDDFSDGNYDDWSVIQGTWAVQNYELSGESYSFYDDARIVAGDPSWTDYRIDVKVSLLGPEQFCILFRVQQICYGVDCGYYYQLSYNPPNDSWSLDNINNCGGAGCPTLASTYRHMGQGGWHNIQIDVWGTNCVCRLDGAELFQSSGLVSYPAGRIGFKVIHSGAHAHFDNVIVQGFPVATDETTWGSIKALWR